MWQLKYQLPYFDILIYFYNFLIYFTNKWKRKYSKHTHFYMKSYIYQEWIFLIIKGVTSMSCHSLDQRLHIIGSIVGPTLTHRPNAIPNGWLDVGPDAFENVLFVIVLLMLILFSHSCIVTFRVHLFVYITERKYM